jgi:hypothetical protein
MRAVVFLFQTFDLNDWVVQIAGSRIIGQSQKMRINRPLLDRASVATSYLAYQAFQTIDQ